MTWDYDASIPTQTDEVRLLIGDTDIANQLLQNEEIAWFLTQETNSYFAAALACVAIASKQTSASAGGTVTSKSVGGLSISYTDTVAKWQGRAAELRAQGNMTSAVPSPISTGMSNSEKILNRDDTDLNLATDKRDLDMTNRNATQSAGG